MLLPCFLMTGCQEGESLSETSVQESLAERLRREAAALLVTRPTYLVIDLSAGPKAESYPVMGRSDVPAGGWTEEDKTTKLVLRRVKAGSFMMGSSKTEEGRYSNEPPHEVMLSEDFYIGVFQVTQKQYELLMGENPSDYKGDTLPVGKVSYDDIRGSLQGANWPEDDSVDEESVLGRLRERTGLKVDLPTEAQWERACRAGSAASFAGTGELDDMGWHSGNSGNRIHPVGEKRPNALGLYDVHGNAWEWCLDWYGSLGADGETDPRGMTTGNGRVRRGGGWLSDVRECRSSNRFFDQPVYRYSDLGFRLACAVGP